MTLKQLTASMRRTEKVINYYNKKYTYDIDLATASEQREWRSALAMWDCFKAKRNEMKAGA